MVRAIILRWVGKAAAGSAPQLFASQQNIDPSACMGGAEPQSVHRRRSVGVGRGHERHSPSRTVSSGSHRERRPMCCYRIPFPCSCSMRRASHLGEREGNRHDRSQQQRQVNKKTNCGGQTWHRCLMRISHRCRRPFEYRGAEIGARGSQSAHKTDWCFLHQRRAEKQESREQQSASREN